MIHQRVKSAFGSNQVHSINRLNFVVCLHLCCLCCVISRRADTRDLLLPLVTRNNQDCFSSLFCKQQQSKWLYPIFVTPAALEQGGFCIDEVYVHKKKSPFICMPFINFSAFHSNTRRTLGFGTAGG
jgi:hypothetical protein